MKSSLQMICLFTILYFSLSGCITEKTPSEEAAATTPTSSNQPTSITPIPTGTEKPNPTETPAPPVTNTPTPQPTRTWQEPATQLYDTDKTYQLIPPSADSLLNIFYGLSVAQPTDDPYDIYYSHEDEENFRRLLTHELAKFDNEALSDASSLLEQLSHEGLYGLEGELDDNRIVQAGFLAALNQAGADLNQPGNIAPFRYRSTTFDLNHDGKRDWLVHVQIPLLHEGYVIPIQQAENGNFAVLPNQMSIETYAPTSFSPQFHISPDVNGDGNPDLIFTKESTYHSDIQIFVWHDNQLIPLNFDQRQGPPWVTISTSGGGDYQFGDFDNDGVFEFRLKVPNWESRSLQLQVCEYQIYLIEWEGTAVTRTQIEQSDEPPKLECLAPEVLFKEPQPLPERPLLENIINQLTPDDWEQFAPWYALAHNKLAAIQWHNGEHAAVQETMAAVWQNSEDAYVKFLEDIWNSSDGDFLTYCRTLHHNFREEPYELADQYSISLAVIGGKFNERLTAIPFGEYFCPSATLTTHYLNVTAFPLTKLPDDILTNSNIPVLFADSFNIDQDPQLERITVIDSGTYMWVAWDQNGEQWEWQQLAVLSESPTTIETFEQQLRDVTGDGYDDLISLREELYSYRNFPQLVLTIFDVTNHSVVIDKKFEHLDINDVDQAFVDSQLPEKRVPTPSYSHQFYIDVTGEQLELGSFLYSITKKLITGKDLALIRSQLEAVKAQIPDDADSAPRVITQLNYLIGYCFEREGKSLEAITQYQKVLETSPDSYWAWLVWARLSPNP